MSDIDILRESDAARGWTFEASLSGPSGSRTVHLHMSWVDYNIWSVDGGDRPADVARAVLRFLAEQEPVLEWADRIDAAQLRRRYPDADRAIPSLIERSGPTL